MHWDAQLEDDKGELLFGRPIRWLLFLYGGRVVPFTIARQALASSPRVQDVTSGAVTYGHRFLATSGRAGRAIKVRSFDEYREEAHRELRDPVAHRAPRSDHARPRGAGAPASAAARCCSSIRRPRRCSRRCRISSSFRRSSPARFSAEFLTLPAEVLTTTLIHHQHFFPVVGSNGALMPAFLAVTNTQATNDRAIATNGERVVTARLRDARFFWDADRKVGLEARLERLETLLFHKQLGSYRQKAERVERLARGSPPKCYGQPENVGRGRAGRAAGEGGSRDRHGPRVHGVARRDGRHLRARRGRAGSGLEGDLLTTICRSASSPTRRPRPTRSAPRAATWAAVSLADKLDTLVGLFLAGRAADRIARSVRAAPAGARRAAPAARRRDAAGVRIAPLARGAGDAGLAGIRRGAIATVWKDLSTFFAERVQHALRGARGDRRQIRAVLAMPDRAVRRRRWRTSTTTSRGCRSSRESEPFRKLATAFKRVRNIARELTAEEFAALQQSPPDALQGAGRVALLDEIERREAAIGAAVAAGQVTATRTRKPRGSSRRWRASSTKCS